MTIIASLVLSAALLATVCRIPRMPSLALALVVTMHGIDQLANAQLPGVMAGVLPNLGIGLVAVLGAGLAMRHRRVVSSWLPTHGHVVLFGIIYALAAIAHGYPPAAGWPAFLIHFIPYFVLHLFLMPLILARTRSTEYGALLRAIQMLSIATMLVVAFDQSLRATSPLDGQRLTLITEEDGLTNSNPLALADIGVFAAVVSFVLGYRSSGEDAWLLRRSVGRVLHPILAGGGFLFLMWLLRISRIEPLAGVFAIGAAWLMRPRRSQAQPIVALIVGLIGMLFFAGVFLESLFESVPQLRQLDEGFLVRFGFIEFCVESYLKGDLPTLLFGLGPGYARHHLGTYPHHHIIEVLTEVGCCGLGVYLWILARSLRASHELMRQAKGELRRFSEFTVTMFLYFLILSMKRGSVIGVEFFMWAVVLQDLRLRLSFDAETPEGRVFFRHSSAIRRSFAPAA